MNKFERYAELIDQLVQLNIDNRDDKPDLKHHMHPMQYAIEMCTVAVTVGRAIGSTTYIKNKTNHRNLPLDLVIVPNERIQHHEYGNQPGVMTVDSILRGATRGLRFDRVYVDEPRMCFRGVATRAEVYAALVSDGRYPLFILLGA